MNGRRIKTDRHSRRLKAVEEYQSRQKVVVFSHKSGIFWDVISIETHSHTAATITHLSRDNSKKIRDVLQGLEK